ncbi:MAG: hypothetical protein AAF412_13785 [Pseudomonadota bacterium]
MKAFYALAATNIMLKLDVFAVLLLEALIESPGIIAGDQAQTVNRVIEILKQEKSMKAQEAISRDLREEGGLTRPCVHMKRAKGMGLYSCSRCNAVYWFDEAYANICASCGADYVWSLVREIPAWGHCPHCAYTGLATPRDGLEVMCPICRGAPLAREPNGRPEVVQSGVPVLRPQ